MSDAILEALEVARRYNRDEIVDLPIDGWRMTERSGDGEHEPDGEGEDWAPCAVAVCGEEWRRGVAGWYPVPGMVRDL